MIRYLLALLIIAAGAAGGFLLYRHLTAGLPVVLPAPHRLVLSAGNAELLPGGWTNSSTLALGAQDPRSVRAGIDVELRPDGQRFKDIPTESIATAKPPATAGDPAVRVHLADGFYRWQVRLHNQQGVSPWVVYHGVIRVDTAPPVVAQVTSPTDPHPGTTYHHSTMRFDWQGGDAGSGIAGYSYRLDVDPHGVARPELRTDSSSVTLGGLDTGSYYFHVRALDHAGNWGPSVTFPVRIDVTPPGLADVRFSLFQFDPQFDSLRVSFAVTRPATTVRIGVYRQSSGSLVRLYRLSDLTKDRTANITWDGRHPDGRLVHPGSFEIYIRTIDRYGHTSLSGWRDFVVDYRRIVVSLSQQKLFAYNGSHLLLSSLVTTGNRALPTPAGTYHIMAKFHPFTFISPWPKSSPYYYQPSKVSYAMLFREGGYFIHDAPWRTAFGPGTNAQLGTPGTNYTGSHGCVNTPANVARELYDWAQIGTIVQVVP